MPPQRDPNRGMVVAREACLIIVGAKAPKYEMVEVVNKRTGQVVTLPKDEPYEPAVEGMPYAFKQYQRVPKTHAAVKESPGSFIPIDELSDAELELVGS